MLCLKQAELVGAIEIVAVFNIVYVLSQGKANSQYFMTIIVAALFTLDTITLSLKGVTIPNDSYVDIDDIGEGNNALLCQCCGSSGDSTVGEWYFPSGDRVQTLRNASIKSNSYFYRNRGIQKVRLNRVSLPPERGRFRCEVLTSSSQHEVYVIIGM